MSVAGLENDVPFDQFSRQYQVMRILNELRPKNKKFRILDVGGYKGRTADFLPKDNLTILDLFDATEENYVKGTALQMPFRAGEFDYVVSFDVLEHIEASKRQQFFEECNRVARQGVIICAPQNTPSNMRAEAYLNKYYEDLHGTQHPWLSEHIAYGLPDFTVIDAQAKRHGLITRSFYSNKTKLWLLMQDVIFLNSKFSLAVDELLVLNSFYNQHFHYDSGGIASESYRRILCCLRDAAADASLVKISEVASKPLDPEIEIELLEHVSNFFLTLAQKMGSLGQDYKGLFEQEQVRNANLLKNNAELQVRLRITETHLNKDPLYRLGRKLSRKRRTRSDETEDH